MANLFKKVFGGGRNPQPKDEVQNPEPAVPDEDRLKLAARKRAARRSGGRASTVMSEGDRLGP